MLSIYKGHAVAQVNACSWPCQVRAKSLSEGMLERKGESRLGACHTKPPPGETRPACAGSKLGPRSRIETRQAGGINCRTRRLQGRADALADQAAIDAEGQGARTSG